MRKTSKILGLAFLTLFVMGTAIAAENNTTVTRGTKPEAEALVKKAVQYFYANGAEKAFAAFSVKGGTFTDRDLYIVAYDSKGTCLAHGQLAILAGKNRLDEQDTDGKYYIKERMDLMKTKTSFWQDYKFTDPLTHKVMPKATYCEVVHDAAYKDALLCAGIYITQAQ